MSPDISDLVQQANKMIQAREIDRMVDWYKFLFGDDYDAAFGTLSKFHAKNRKDAAERPNDFWNKVTAKEIFIRAVAEK